MYRLAFGLLLAGTACAPAWAADTDETSAADDTRSTILVIGQTATDAAEARAEATPGGTDVVTHADFADKTLVSLRDTLSFSPGVYTQPRFGQEVRISIRGSGLSRGFHMRGLTLLQDGVPINLADDNGDFQELEPIFFDHLEVYRGANALRFGSGTLGGAINGVTPTGRDAPGLYLRADAGSFDMLRGLVTFGGSSGAADYWAGVSTDTAAGDRQHANRDSIRFHGNLGLALSNTVSTRFYASVNTLDQELPGALTAAVALTAPETGNFVGDQARDISSVRLQNRTRFELGAATLEVGGFLNAKSLYHPIFQVIDHDSRDYGAFARLDYAQGPFELTIGGEIRRGSTDASQFTNVNGARGMLVFEADQDARTANLYAEARYRPVEALTLIVGGIYADGFRKRAIVSSTMPMQDGRIAFGEFSPKFGVLFAPAADMQVFANYSRSAEFPGMGEVFQTVAGVSTFIAAIEPQRAWTAEVGTRGRSGPVSWDLAFYRAKLEGELLQYTISTSIPAATFNAERTLHQGIEAGLSVELADWLRLRQIWQYSDFRFEDDRQFGDNRLPVVPEHLLRTELRLGSDALHVAPNLEWVPEGAFADYRNTTRTDGYVLVGLTAGATVTDGIDVFLDARNLFDERAIGDISAALAATATSAIYYPVERRAVYGGVRARF
ncbi:MAG: ligand-gated channel protein [Sphingomonadales bacterium 32-68-7]|nr:MAG: ligand-gated channel protein [Sphingomonadales bacterium 12-68-11]OYX09306.1 MAG: ligand-gated channel protein [Sphingomonadales bacterium 32-68-7]